MRYIFIGVVLIFIGCGDNSSSDNRESNISNPDTPITKDSSKRPPAIPDI
jgi:hypothetical protein